MLFPACFIFAVLGHWAWAGVCFVLGLIVGWVKFCYSFKNK